MAPGPFHSATQSCFLISLVAGVFLPVFLDIPSLILLHWSSVTLVPSSFTALDISK